MRKTKTKRRRKGTDKWRDMFGCGSEEDVFRFLIFRGIGGQADEECVWCSECSWGIGSVELVERLEWMGDLNRCRLGELSMNGHSCS